MGLAYQSTSDPVGKQNLFFRDDSTTTCLYSFHVGVVSDAEVKLSVLVENLKIWKVHFRPHFGRIPNFQVRKKQLSAATKASLFFESPSSDLSMLGERQKVERESIYK